MNGISFPRREFIACCAGFLTAGEQARAKVNREPGVKLKLALNAYSFDKPLRAGSMTLEDVVHFCAQYRVDALDATGYYFPGYPEVPSDGYIYKLKRSAFLNGIQLSTQTTHAMQQFLFVFDGVGHETKISRAQ